MKLVIDGRFWGPSHSGLGVYTRQLVCHLAKRPAFAQVSVLLRRETMGSSDFPTNFQAVELDAKAYTLWEQFAVAIKLYLLSPDLVHFPSINVPVLYFGKYVITVHDLIKHGSRGVATTTHHPLVYWPKYFLYLATVWWAAHWASKILVPSHDVKAKLLATYHLPAEKIIVTHEAPVLVAFKSLAHLTGFPEKFAIYTGNAYPHKNLETLIAIWNKVFTQTGVKLVISSGRSIFSDRIEAAIAKNNASSWVIFKGYLSDKELAAAYHQAQAYVFPTLAEGFGLPGLDALKFGLPLSCSDLPVLHEVYGDAAIYFDPHNPADITEKIISVLSDVRLRQKLIGLGKKQVAKYSWAKTAAQTAKVYESCLGLRSR